MATYSGSHRWWHSGPLVLVCLLCACGTETTTDTRFEGTYLLTVFPGPECVLPAALNVEVEAKTLLAAGPGDRLEVTLRPLRPSGVFALTVDLLYAGTLLRGGMTAGKESQCYEAELDCGVATAGSSAYRLHLEGIAEGTADNGRVVSGSLEGDVLLSSPGDDHPDTLGACSSDGHRWSLEPLGTRRGSR